MGARPGLKCAILVIGMSRETRSNSDKEKIDRLYKIATEDKQIKLKIQSSISNLLSSTSTKGTPTTSQQINYSSEHPTIQSDSTDTTLSFESPNSTFVNSEYSIKKNLVKLNLVKFDINNEQIDKYESDSRELTKMALTDSFDSLGYAVEAVPYFDGNNIPLSYFIEGCEEAKSMLPKEAELLFTRIIRTRIIGETRRTIQDHEFDTILQLTKYLKPIYGITKNIYQLQGELGCIYQRNEEDVITYANRVRTLGKQILEVYQQTQSVIYPIKTSKHPWKKICVTVL